VLKADSLPPSFAVVTKSGNLNFLESSGPLRACNGTALPLPFTLTVYIFNTYGTKLPATDASNHSPHFTNSVRLELVGLLLYQSSRSNVKPNAVRTLVCFIDFLQLSSFFGSVPRTIISVQCPVM